MTTPPIDWFRDPKLDGPTPVTVTPEGRVFGHIATWDTPHMGMPGKNIRPPRSASDYGMFHVGAVEVVDGDESRDISCGKLTLDTGHASLTSDASETASHYDNTGTAVANVCAGEDAYGIWFSGAVAPGVDDLKRHRLKASAVSGDWRPVNGHLELVAALMVNTPGFPIPRARVASAAELAPLVAANVVPNPVQEDTVPEIKKGDYVELALDEVAVTAAVGQVVEAVDGGYVVEVPVSASGVKPATEKQALAASAIRTERQRVATLESRLEELTARLEARDRADAASSLLASLPEA
jgi:hypothetical protein